MQQAGHFEKRNNMLTPAEQRRLEAILARLASPYEGERAAAALLASAFVQKHALVWADVVAMAHPAMSAGSSPTEATTPAAPAGGTSSERLSSPQDRRRRNERVWQVYCRRRRGGTSQVLDRIA